MKTADQPTTNAKRASPAEVLRSVFVERKAKNTSYSLNAFARDLDLSPSLISRILNGSRSVTLKQGLHIAAVLGFGHNETNSFILSIVEGAGKSAKITKKIRAQILERGPVAGASFESPVFINYDVERFKAIAQWYHLAILNLTYVQDFSSDPRWIAERLGLEINEVKLAIARLLELGFLEKTNDGVLKKTSSYINFKTTRSESAVRSFHTQMIEKAKTQLNRTSPEDFERRHITGITFSCPKSSVDQFKKKISEFQDECLAMAKTGTHEEVYQLNVQLFPLTNSDKGKNV